MNTAKLYQFPKSESTNVADIEDGYTRIANDLLEEIVCADLTARQIKILLTIIRKTYGFGKKLDRITNTQIAAITGIHHTHVCKEKNKMISMKILISEGRMIGINKKTTEWNFNISQNSESLAKSANKSLAKSANSYKPSQLNTKETITKEKRKYITPIVPLKKSESKKTEPKKTKSKKVDFDVRQEPIPDWLNKSVWQDWLDYREGLKKPIKARQTFNGQIKLLTECYESGQSPEDVLNTSITNGWQGLFKPKSNQAKKHGIQHVEKHDIFITEDF